MSDGSAAAVARENSVESQCASLTEENASLRAALAALSDEYDAMKSTLAQTDVTIMQLVTRVRNLETQLLLGELTFFKRMLGIPDGPQPGHTPQPQKRRIERHYLHRNPVPAYALPAKLEAALAPTGATVVQLHGGEYDDAAVADATPLQSSPFVWWQDVVVEPEPEATSPLSEKHDVGPVGMSPTAATPPRVPGAASNHDTEDITVESGGDRGEDGDADVGASSLEILDDIAHNRISQDEMREIMRIAAERRAVRFQQGGTGGKGKRTHRPPPPAERSPTSLFGGPLMRWPSSF